MSELEIVDETWEGRVNTVLMRYFLKRFFTAVGFVSYFFFARSLWADDPSVLIVSGENQAPLVEALQLELDAAAFDTRVEWRVPRPEPFADFAEVADESDASVWIRIFADARVEIWTADLKADKVLHRETALSPESRSDPFQAAMEIAELLRATRLELFEAKASEPLTEPVDAEPDDDESAEDVSESQPPPEQMPSPEKTQTDAVNASQNEQTTEPLRHQPLLEVGPGISAGDFSHRPTALIHLAAEWRFIKRIGAVLFGNVALSSTRGEAPAGVATLKSSIIGLEARVTFPALSKRFRPGIGVGAGLVISKIEGEAAPGYIPKNETLLAARLHLGLSGAVVITERLALTFGAALAHCPKGVTVNINGEQSLKWGDIILDGTVGLEIGLL